jgi:uncharacterized protein YjbJ (UPF0337 family)
MQVHGYRAPARPNCWAWLLLKMSTRQYWRFIRSRYMNKDQVKGVGEQAKGKVNETVGKVTGNKSQELKGDLQQGLGKVQKAHGDAKEEVKDELNRKERP